MWDFLYSVDSWLFYAVNRGGENFLFDRIMPVISNFDYLKIPLLLLLLALFFFGGRKGKLVAISAILIVGFCDLVSSSVLKPLIGRVRPCNVLGGVHLFFSNHWILTPEIAPKVYKASFSFPSSHAVNIFAGASLFSLYYRKWMPALLAVAVLVAYSRVYLGVHYPSDVLIGALVGVGLGVLGATAARRTDKLLGVAWKRKQEEKNHS